MDIANEIIHKKHNSFRLIWDRLLKFKRDFTRRTIIQIMGAENSIRARLFIQLSLLQASWFYLSIINHKQEFKTLKVYALWVGRQKNSDLLMICK